MFLRPVTGNDIAQRPEHRTFLAAASSRLRGGSHDAARQTTEGQRLQPHSTRTAERRKKHALAAEYRGFDSTDILDVVFDCGLQCNKTARVDAKHLARFESFFDQHPAGVDECPPVTLQALHNEPFTTEEPRAEAFLKRDADADTLGGHQERIPLRNQFPSNFGEFDRHDSPGIRSRERDPLLALSGVHENRHEQGLTDEEALPGAEKRVHKTRALLGTIAKYGFHADTIFHVKHSAGLRYGRLTRIQLDFDKLYVFTEHFVIHFMHCCHDLFLLSSDKILGRCVNT